MRKFLHFIVLAIGASLLSLPAYGLEGVLLDGAGNYVTDGFGECVSVDKLKHFHRADGTGYCEDLPEKVAKTAPTPAPAPEPATYEIVTTLDAHALFSHDRSDLRPAGRSELDALVSSLKGYSSIQSISVIGHTDSQGSEAYNQRLSERRAESVKNYLIEQGIDAAVISTLGRGETQPVASNDTAAGRQQNRRVEIAASAPK